MLLFFLNLYVFYYTFHWPFLTNATCQLKTATETQLARQYWPIWIVEGIDGCLVSSFPFRQDLKWDCLFNFEVQRVLLPCCLVRINEPVHAAIRRTPFSPHSFLFLASSVCSRLHFSTERISTPPSNIFQSASVSFQSTRSEPKEALGPVWKSGPVSFYFLWRGSLTGCHVHSRWQHIPAGTYNHFIL